MIQKNGGWTLDDRDIVNPPYAGMSGGKPVLHVSRPADKSLEAYKRWLTEMFEALGGKGDTMAEEKWIAGWKEFWEQAKPEDGPRDK